VDRVLPDVPIRQWVLSVPYRLRYRLAWDHDLCRAVAGVLIRSVVRVLRDRARDAGVERGHGGAVVLIQRFGGALNLNVHFHSLVPDGVFAGEPGKLAFHGVGQLTALDAEEVLAAVEPLVDRRLRARGESDDDGVASDPWVVMRRVSGRVGAGRQRTGASLGSPSRAAGEHPHGGTSGAGGPRIVRGARERLQPARRSRRAGRATRAAGERVPLRAASAGAVSHTLHRRTHSLRVVRRTKRPYDTPAFISGGSRDPLPSSLRSDECTACPESAFMIAGTGVHLGRNTQKSASGVFYSDDGHQNGVTGGGRDSRNRCSPRVAHRRMRDLVHPAITPSKGAPPSVELD
jgi:Putative transposase